MILLRPLTFQEIKVVDWAVVLGGDVLLLAMSNNIVQSNCCVEAGATQTIIKNQTKRIDN